MENREKYKYVYENWYVKSCNKADETPVNFNNYYRIVSQKQIDEIMTLLKQGITP